MSRKDSRNTKGRIVNAAWELFYEQGYDNTTIDEIVERSETSKGSFYHYFDSKDALLSTLSVLFDSKYDELRETLDPSMNSLDKLLYLNRALFKMIEDSVPVDLLSRLFSSQLITVGERHLLDQNRSYYRLLRKIIVDGQRSGELRTDFSVNEIVKAYALCERGIMYDWCICSANYSLYQYSSTVLPLFLRSFQISKNSEENPLLRPSVPSV